MVSSVKSKYEIVGHLGYGKRTGTHTVESTKLFSGVAKDWLDKKQGNRKDRITMFSGTYLSPNEMKFETDVGLVIFVKRIR